MPIREGSDGKTMAGRFRLVVAYSLLLPPACGLTGARAAEPGFCGQYARAAIVQVREALADPRCGASVGGVRWSMDFATQYEWCLGVSRNVAGGERAGRRRYLRTCSSR